MPQNPAHTLEGLALGYLLVGTFLFFIVSTLGLVESAVLSRAARGKTSSCIGIALGIALNILIWPLTAKRLWVHRKATGKMLARNLWGRG